MDVLDTILLSLHPQSKLKVVTLSEYTKEGLAEMQDFKHSILKPLSNGEMDICICRSLTLIP